MSNKQLYVENILYFIIFFYYVSLLTTTRVLRVCATQLETFTLRSVLLP